MCRGLNVFSKNSSIRILMCTDGGVRRWGLWEVLKKCGGRLHEQESFLIKDTLESSHQWCEDTMRSLQSGKQCLPYHEGTLMPDFPPPEL